MGGEPQLAGGAISRKAPEAQKNAKPWPRSSLAPFNRTDAKAPLVCHVLNRDFDAVAERLAPIGNLTVLIDIDLFGGRLHARCRCFAPSQPPRELAVRRMEKQIEVVLPVLDAWAVLRFESFDPAQFVTQSGRACR